jgi:phosphate starvation-inducible PhoH-like protein
MDLLMKPKPAIVIASGAAGTGKTMLSTVVGIQKLRQGEVERLIITRPMVSADEDIGYLPGSLDQKFMPWVRPIHDVLAKYYSPHEIERLFKSQTIELSPISFMRGRSFDNCFIICDEVQNCTARQVLMLLTRIGLNSKMVITGDPSQHDRDIAEVNGLTDLLQRIVVRNTSEDIEVVELWEDSIQRHPVIKDIIAMYR